MRKSIVLSMALILAMVFMVGTAVEAVYLPDDFSGTEIDVYMVAERRAEMVSDFKHEFEEETGITVNINTLPYPNLQEVQFIELAMGEGPDVIHVDQVWLGQYEDYLEPIQRFIDDPDLTDKEQLDLDDFHPTILDLQTSYRDELLGFPFIGAIRMIYYRTDLFEEYADDYYEETGMELDVPDTWLEYKEIARFFEENVEGVHGTTIMGRRGVQLYCDVMPILWSFGGSVIEGPEGQPAIEEMEGIRPNINSPESIEALEFFNSLSEYASPGITDWDWDESANAFAQGNAALAMQWNNAAPVFAGEDSEIRGDWEAAIVPGMSENDGIIREALLGGWTLGVNANSPNQEAAYLFTKWVTSKEMEINLAPGGGNARESTFTDPELSEEYIHYEATFESYDIARSRPRIPQLTEIADISQTAFSRILTGEQEVVEALNNAQDQLEELDL